MKIAIFYRYFWPDTAPYASMLKEMTHWFVSAGHDVEVITGQPGYKKSTKILKQAWKETLNDGVRVRRLMLFKERSQLFKAINYLLFITRSFFHILFGPKRDVIIAGTAPPVFQALLISIAAKIRGSEFIYHMQDVHPEIAFVKGGKMTKSIGFKCLQWLDISSNKRATINAVIGDDMAEVIRTRGARGESIKVIRNFAVDKKRSRPAVVRPVDRPVRFVFAGNIGVFQNLDSLLPVFTRFDPSEIQLVLVGEGRAKKTLIRKVKEQNIRNVEFHDHMSEQDVFDFLCDQDVGLVSLLPGIYKYAVPSKIWTYIAADLPILFMVEEDSKIATFLETNNFGAAVGWQASENKIEQTIKTIAEKVRNEDYKISMQKHKVASSVARQHWVDILAHIEAKRRKS